MRDGQRFVLAGQRRGGYLRDHESGVDSRLRRQESREHAGQRIGHLFDAPLGNSAERGDRDCDLVRSHRQRLTVKISAADDVAAAVADEYERIVGGAVQFYGCHLARLRQRIAHRAVHLRRAAQAVGILHARIFFRGTMRFANLAAFVQAREVARRHRGAGVRTCVHDARVECAGTSAQRVERQCRGNIRGVHQQVGIAESEAQQRQHPLRAVKQGQSFFGFQRDRCDARAAHGFRAVQRFTAINSTAFANRDVREMRQRR